MTDDKYDLQRLERRHSLLEIKDEGSRPLVIFRIVDGVLTAIYDPDDLDEAARVFTVYLIAKEMDRLVEAQRKVVEMLIEGSSVALDYQSKNTRLREALADAIECMKDYERTPVSAHTTLKDDIARIESVISTEEDGND